MKVIINLSYFKISMQSNKNKKVYIFLVIAGVLMLVINVLLIFTVGGSFSNYMGLLAGLAFTASGFSSLKKVSDKNI